MNEVLWERTADFSIYSVQFHTFFACNSNEWNAAVARHPATWAMIVEKEMLLLSMMMGLP
jgi:hypothetical protein